MSSAPIAEPIGGLPYPTLSGKPGSTTFSNPPFDSRILNIGGGNTAVNPPYTGGQGYAGNGTTGNIQRGKLTTGTNKNAFGTNNGIVYEVNFLYNPSTISESRAIDVGSASPLPSNSRIPNDIGQYMTSLNTTVGFSLLFDRTYEVWDASNAALVGTSQAGTYGCRVDVEALYNLCGINQKLNATPAASTGQTAVSPTGGSPNYNITVQGSMLAQPTQLYFGAQSPWALNYYGFISELAVTWTHFNAAMVPVRCAVDIQFTCMPINTSNYSGVFG